VSQLSRSAVALSFALALALAAARPRPASADEAPVARVWASPQPTGETLRAVWGNEAGVWAVGDAGAILRSIDHGASWASVDSGTTRNLKAIWGSTEGDLWIAGDGATVLRSTDAGKSWHRMTVPVAGAGSLEAIWGSDPHDVYVAGSAGRLLHSDDHGRSFTTSQPLGETDEQLTAVWGSAADDLYVTGDRGSVVTSSDRGQHWTALRKQTPRPPASDEPAAPRSGTKSATKTDSKIAPKIVSAMAAPIGAPPGGSSAQAVAGTARGDWLAVFTSWTRTRKGSTTAMEAQHTTDGGKTWKEPRIDPSPAPWPSFRAFHSADNRMIYGVAAFELWDRPVEERQRIGLIVSRDGGSTFERRSLLPRGGGVNGLWRDPTGPLIAVGPLGLLLRSRDDGRTWEESSTHPFGNAMLNALWTDGTGQVWVVGDDCTVLHSSDGGTRFDVQRPCPAGAGTDLRSVWGSGADDVYIAGAFISRTVDRGQHWAVVNPPSPVAARWRVWGSGAGDVYVAGYGIWRSTDSAQSWKLVDGSRSRNPSDWFSDLFGVGDTRYAFTELGRLERGSKTGASWRPVAPPAPSWRCCAFWADGASGLYAIGPNHALFRSTDAGQSFQPIATPLGKLTTFMALHRRGDQLYLLADDPLSAAQQRTLLTSDDSGLTWRTYATLPWGATALGTVESDLMIVGANGLMLRLR
jgi:photosystem II stability/assembly factor-like uncharacterized protein